MEVWALSQSLNIDIPITWSSGAAILWLKKLTVLLPTLNQRKITKVSECNRLIVIGCNSLVWRKKLEIANRQSYVRLISFLQQYIYIFFFSYSVQLYFGKINLYHHILIKFSMGLLWLLPDSGVLWKTEMLHFPSFAPWEILTENSYMLSAYSVSIIILLWVLSLYSQRADSPFSLYLTV